MKLFKVSIIVPIYNVEDYIEECLQSIVNQDYQGEIECILVDDCGCDRSLELTEHFIALYTGGITFTILHHQRNRGLSAARNTGMDAASGDYIFFLDSDDMITSNCISSLSQLLLTEPYDVVIGGVKWKVPSADYNYPMAWNKLYRTDYLRNERLYFEEGLVHEDDLWTFEVDMTARKKAVCEHITYIYRTRENSITGQLNRERSLYYLKQVLFLGGEFIKQRKLRNNYKAYYWLKYRYRIIFNELNAISFESARDFYYCFSDSYIYTIKDLLRFVFIEKRFLGGIVGFHWMLPKKVGFRLYLQLRRFTDKV